MASTVVGMFDERDDAQHAVQDLISEGFSKDRVSIVTNDAEGKLQQQHADSEGNIAAEGASTGLASGAVVGGLLGLLIGAGIVFFPPAGVVAAGPIAGLIAGAAAGAATGGVLGGLIGMGIPKEHAEIYAEGIRRGGTVVTVQTTNDDEMSRAHRILDRDGAVDIEDRAAQYRSQGFTGYDPNSKPMTEAERVQDRQRIAPPVQANTSAPAEQMAREGDRLEVTREELQVGKREEQRGGVRIRSYMTEQPVSEQVTLREEHVNVDRRPVDRPADPNTLSAFKEGTVEMREVAEVPVVAKEARVVEEVLIGKTANERVETIQDTVRETHVDVEQLGDQFRRDFARDYPAGASNYDEYQPIYQYGYQAANDPRFQGRPFEEAETDIRQDYRQRYPQGDYDQHRMAIASGYGQAASRGGTSGRAYADTPTGVPNGTPGVQTGGHAIDGTPDTRGLTEKAVDTVTGDRTDDKTGKQV